MASSTKRPPVSGGELDEHEARIRQELSQLLLDIKRIGPTYPEPNENKNLIEKVHRLEEELRECIEEREIWKLKATKLQEDLIGKLMSYEY